MLLQRQCAATIEKYGVGSCGPRAFYGTIDVHLTLEVCKAVLAQASIMPLCNIIMHAANLIRLYHLDY